MNTVAKPELLNGSFSGYQCDDFFDEMFERPGNIAPHYEKFARSFGRLTPEEFNAKRHSVDLALLRQGVTFNVYGDARGAERIFPFDLMPRIIPASEWEYLERGLIQRITALNLFLHDIYHEQKIVKDGIIPAHYILSGKHFRREFVNFAVPKDIYIHVCGTDLIRDDKGQYLVLEDNGRCPSGVSYVLENRRAMKRDLPRHVRKHRRAPRRSLPAGAAEDAAIHRAAGRGRTDGRPADAGRLQQRLLRAHLSRAADGHSKSSKAATCWCATNMCSCARPKDCKPVHVIYRRIDDDFLDPTVFRRNSMLGVPGLVSAYRAGNVSLANSIGTGIADDKVMYYFVPKMIKYYLDQEPIIPNVPTYLASEETDLKFILDNLEKLVVKAANESGGYGMLMGPKASKAEIWPSSARRSKPIRATTSPSR